MRSAIMLAAAGLSGIAAIIHAYVTPEHFEEAWILGAFFVTLAALQAAFTFEVLRAPRHGLLLAGIFLNAIVIVIYIVTRTIGVPLGEHTEPESVGILDATATIAELALITLLIFILPQHPDKRANRPEGARPPGAPPPPPRFRTMNAQPIPA